MSRGKLGAVLLLLSLLLEAASARASDGLLNAYGIAAPPPGFALKLRLSDDSPANVAIFERFTEALKAQGWIISKDSPLVLDLEPRVVGSGFGNDGGRSDVYDQWEDINRLSGKTLETFRKAEKQPSVRPSSKLVLTATLRDGDSGHVMWQGTAEASGHGGDPAPLGVALAPHLAAALGKTIRNQPITLAPQ